MKRLAGNVAIITGGGKGIGYGIAQAFAQEGCNLVITGRTESRLLAAKEKLERIYAEIGEIEKKKVLLCQDQELLQTLKIEQKEKAERLQKARAKLNFTFAGDDESAAREFGAILAGEKAERDSALANFEKASDEYQKASDDLNSKREQWAIMQSAHATLEKSESDAKAISENARKVYQDALDKNAAIRVQSTLKMGDVCPVCGNHVISKPTIQSNDVIKAQEESERAQKEYEKVQTELNQSAAALSGVGEQVNGAMETFVKKLLLLLDMIIKKFKKL